MKKFSKIIAGISAFSMCVSAMSINNAFAVKNEYPDFSGHNGDINSDGIIDAVDASLILSDCVYNHTSQTERHLLSEEQLALADINNDGSISAVDASHIMEAYIKLSVGSDSPEKILENSDSLGNSHGTANNGFSDAEISESPVKPCITVDTITLSYDEASAIAEKGGTVSVNVTISGADAKYCSTGLHVNSPELNIATKGTDEPMVKAGNAIDMLNVSIEKESENSVFLATFGSHDNGWQGIMYTIDFRLPEDIQGGEYFPINIDYQNNENAGDLFTNYTNDETGKLMQAYLFTQGIANGGIQIEYPSMSTTTSTTATTIATTTTATATTTSGNTDIVLGDANGDGEINSADAVFIMQALSNPDEYKLTEEGKANADVVNRGDGVTAMDALAIQLIGLNLVKAEDFPITTEDLESLMK